VAWSRSATASAERKCDPSVDSARIPPDRVSVAPRRSRFMSLMLSALPIIPATRQPTFTSALNPSRASRPDLLRDQLGEPGLLRRRHQDRPRPQILVIEGSMRPGRPGGSPC
jgi:hypothetical protein